jgi:hypothetical protein
VLAAGGLSRYDHQLASAELYDPGSESWTPTGAMRVARSRHTATLLPDGRVLVAGGFDIQGAMDANVESMGRGTPEVFDPSSGRWSRTGSMAFPRAGHTATLLTDGRLLVAGGDAVTDGGPTAELYDPATGRWTATREHGRSPARPRGDASARRPGPRHWWFRGQRIHRGSTVRGAARALLGRGVRSGHRAMDRHREHARRPCRTHGDSAAGRHGSRRRNRHHRRTHPAELYK